MELSDKIDMKTKSSNLKSGLIVILISVILVGFGLLTSFLSNQTQEKSAALEKSGITTTAEVLSIKEDRSTRTDSNGNRKITYSYTPIAQYSLEDGSTLKYTFTELKSNSRTKFVAGDQIEIAYDKANPKTVAIIGDLADSENAKSGFLSLGLLIGGGLFFILGLFTLLKKKNDTEEVAAPEQTEKTQEFFKNIGEKLSGYNENANGRNRRNGFSINGIPIPTSNPFKSKNKNSQPQISNLASEENGTPAVEEHSVAPSTVNADAFAPYVPSTPESPVLPPKPIGSLPVLPPKPILPPTSLIPPSSVPQRKTLPPLPPSPIRKNP